MMNTSGRGEMNFLSLIRTLILLSLSFSGWAQCPALIWADEFTGSTLNTADWNYETGAAQYNNELEYYTSRSNNIGVSNGKLIITALQESYGGNSYTSAKINSSGKHSFKYGRIEASIKLPKTQGLWPAFWMMPQTSPNGGWPSSGEIDIMEELGSNPYKDFGTIHYGTDAGTGHKSSGGTITSASDLSAGFHTYAIEWKPDTISWYLDNVNFYTITRSSIAPSYWPFNDDNFFLILNVAVGGWFGGNPNGSTVFPQTMEVDYVRVYSNPYTLQITGRSKVLSGSTYTYQIKNGTADSYTWTAPAGTIINSGQGTNTASLTWADTGGAISMDAVHAPCGTFNFTRDIIVYKDSCDFMLDDFQSNRRVGYTSSSGTAYNPASANPNTANTVNTSPVVAYYQRNGSVQYDTYIYEAELISNTAIFESGDKVFYMDVYTNAAIGTAINLQLEDKDKTWGAYPLGRRSIFVAYTTKTNQWERLKFTLATVPSGSTTLATEVDQITFLFKPNSYTNNYYYFDNLMMSDKNGCPAILGLQNFQNDQNILISPNPASYEITIHNNSGASDMAVSIIDVFGREVMHGTSSESSQSINISDLPSGIYFVNLISGSAGVTRKLIVE
jgi:beta-glucanase (GH16 family)